MNNRRGFTLLELMVGIAILAVTIVSLYGVLASSTQSFKMNNKLETIQESARRTMDQIMEELRLADSNPGSANPVTITNVAGSNTGSTTYFAASQFAHSLTFVRCTSYTGGSASWTTPITYAWVASPWDAQQDGIVNEGILTRTNSGATSVVCRNVAPGGFTVTRNGNVMTVNLMLTIRDDQGRVLRSPVQSSVALRNTSSP